MTRDVGQWRGMMLLQRVEERKEVVESRRVGIRSGEKSEGCVVISNECP
jgi:hypothetical protein